MTWTEIWKELNSTDPGVLAICIRLACAMLVGLVIGVEREYTHRPAGMRTHILVALGACVVAVTGDIMFHYYTPLGGNADPARLSAQVITGIGFLGAGTIMREGATVKGLTTAASVWATACLGIAAGYGFYALALVGMLFILVTLTVFEFLQSKLIKPGKDPDHYTLETINVSASLSLINTKAQLERGIIQNLTCEDTDTGHRISFHADFHGRHNKKHCQRFVDALASAPETVKLTQAGEEVHTPV